MSVTFGLPSVVQFPSDPCYIRLYPWFLRRNVSSVCHCRLSPFVAMGRARGAQMRGGGRGHTGGKNKCADVRGKLFWRAIYFANPRPDVGSQSSSRSRRGLGSQAPRIICEYDFVTAIVIRPLIHPRTCEMGSSIFAAMSRLKFASMTSASLPSMSSTERKNREKCFRCSWQCLPCLFFFIFSHQYLYCHVGRDISLFSR